MLVSEIIKIKIRKNIIEHYNKLNYNITDNEINVNTNDLHKGSKSIIKVVCDNCGEIIYMEYRNYYKIINKYNDNLYFCKKCKYQRIKNTNSKKYGVENVMQVEDIKEKNINNQIKIYGALGIQDKDKKHKGIINKYGNLENYYNIINDKRKNTCLEKYGVENVMQVEDIKRKNELTCLKNYGVINPMFNSDIVNKSKTNQINTKLNKNIIISDANLSDFKKYKKVIRRLVYKYKKQLFSNWDGYDYYDGEYIKNYLSLNHTNNKYPTIDHKISVFYGFNNNIIPTIIGDIDNLCITKRYINSSKHTKNNHK